MVKEVINTEVDEGIFIYFLLDHDVPHAVGFPLIHVDGFFVENVIMQFSFIKKRIPGLFGIFYAFRRQGIFISRHGIAVEHMNIVFPPNTAAPTGFFIFIIQAYIDFMLRFIQ